MVALYCKEKILHLRKCCDLDQNLNLRARSCTSHLARPWVFPPVFSLWGDGGASPPALVASDNSTQPELLPWNIPNMVREGGKLYVASENFSFLDDGRLYFEGRFYGESDYCLDYSVDYCGGLPSASLRAVIDDPSLAQVTASAIFGTNKEDSPVSLAIKKVGYPVSIGFLVVTLAVFLVVPELRKESGIKHYYSTEYSPEGQTDFMTFFFALYRRTFTGRW